MSIVNRVVFGFAFAVLLLAVIGSISYRNTMRLLADAQWVEHTDRVLTRLGAVLSDEQDLETGQRGYLLTGEERYLEPYTAGLQGLHAICARSGIRRATIRTSNGGSTA